VGKCEDENQSVFYPCTMTIHAE